jgi:hypothetical protein
MTYLADPDLDSKELPKKGPYRDPAPLPEQPMTDKEIEAQKEIRITKIVCSWAFVGATLFASTCAGNTFVTESSKVGVARANADIAHEEAVKLMWEHQPIPIPLPANIPQPR